MTTEIWKPVPDYDGWYEASNWGRVRSWRNGRHGRRAVPKILKPGVDGGGYMKLNVRLSGSVPRTVKVHILVALAFLGPRPDGYDINHIDGDKTNNHISNLEYVTRSSNTIHARDLMGNMGCQILTRAQAGEIIALLTEGKLMQSAIGATYGIESRTVSDIWDGKRWADLPRPYPPNIPYNKWRGMQREKGEATDLIRPE